MSFKLALLLAALLASALIAVSEWSYQRAATAQAARVEQSRSHAAAQTVLARLVDAETAQRGYLLTGRTVYLAPYKDAEADVMAALQLLQNRHPPGAMLSPLIDQVREPAAQRLSELKLTLALYEEGRHEAWRNIVLTDIGRDGMTALREATAALLLVSESISDQTERDVSRALQIGRLAVLATALLGLLGVALYLHKKAALQRANQLHALARQQAQEQLEGQVRARTFDIGLVHQQQQNLRDDERLVLARALHDELGALLTAAKLDITRMRRLAKTGSPEMMARVQHLADTLDEGIAMKRRAVEDLMPSPLHNLGLRQAVEQLVDAFTQRCGLAVEAELADDMVVDATSRNVGYQLVKECLSNIERHAQASAVGLLMRQEDDALHIRISDNGKGFEPLRSNLKSYGLKSLRYRLEMLGGKMDVVSAPGRGAEVSAWVPLNTSSSLPTAP